MPGWNCISSLSADSTLMFSIPPLPHKFSKLLQILIFPYASIKMGKKQGKNQPFFGTIFALKSQHFVVEPPYFSLFPQYCIRITITTLAVYTYISILSSETPPYRPLWEGSSPESQHGVSLPRLDLWPPDSASGRFSCSCPPSAPPGRLLQNAMVIFF